MGWRIAVACASLSALLISCDGASLTGASLSQPIVLRAGQSARIASEPLEVGFARVTSDSRCPAQAACFWEGVATVEIWASVRESSKTTLTIQTTDAAGYSRETSHAGYRFRLVSLEPSPPGSGSIPPDQYVLTLVVTPEP
jgi:hypothetical protein